MTVHRTTPSPLPTRNSDSPNGPTRSSSAAKTRSSASPSPMAVEMQQSPQGAEVPASLWGSPIPLHSDVAGPSGAERAHPGLGSPIRLSAPMAPSPQQPASPRDFDDSPPPYSENRYPESHGLIGLGIAFAAALPSMQSPPGFVPVFDPTRAFPRAPRLTYEPLVELHRHRAAASYWSSPSPEQDERPPVRRRLSYLPPEQGPASAAPSPAPRSPTNYAFTFTFPMPPFAPRPAQQGQPQPFTGWHGSPRMAESPGSADMQAQRSAPAALGHVSAASAASAAAQLSGEAESWLQKTASKLTAAGFSQAQCRALALQLSRRARDLVMWNLSPLADSGYAPEDLMDMLTQPGPELWLSTLARVLPRLRSHNLSAADVVYILGAPAPDELLRAYEPGPSRR